MTGQRVVRRRTVMRLPLWAGWAAVVLADFALWPLSAGWRYWVLVLATVFALTAWAWLCMVVDALFTMRVHVTSEIVGEINDKSV